MAKVADRSALKAARGKKHTCKSCGARFYDLNRDEIFCPACGAAVEVEAPAAAPAPEPKPVPKPKETKADTEAEKETEAKPASEEGPEFVSLEEAAADEGGDVEVEDDVVVLDDDDDDIPDSENDDTFLETEDEGDSNVSDIIGSPIKSEDEG